MEGLKVPSRAGIRVVGRRRLGDGDPEFSEDRVIEECPVALVYNGISHAVMMATPVDLEDFALGFSLSEGILSGPEQLLGVDIIDTEQGIEVRLDILTVAFETLKGRRRQLAGRSGCGLCGKESLGQALVPLPELPAALPISAAAITQAVSGLRGQQFLQQETGASHAAAWCSPGGDILLLREDVGRHNALDKLIGALRCKRSCVAEEAAEGFVLITSRASYEMVAKCAVTGLGALVALSAATSMAVDAAVAANVSLVGFAAGQAPVLYHGSVT
jgi:FdhD protein